LIRAAHLSPLTRRGQFVTTISENDVEPWIEPQREIEPVQRLKSINECWSQATLRFGIDAFRVVTELIKEIDLMNYRVATNRPGYQAVTYLRFRLSDR
jgi:hypothetical protein